MNAQPKEVVSERVISDDEAVFAIIINWPRDRVIKFALNLLGGRAKAWYARIEEHQN
jgi:hypothetical protein